MASFDEKREALRQRQMLTGKKLFKSALFLLGFLAFMTLFMVPMGMTNAINTMMNTAYRILLDTVFYIMAIAVLAGALSEMLTEFGVLELFNFLLSPLMKPLYGMPGAAALGVVSTYFSDNPSILALAKEQQYRRYFKAYQIPALTNLGTAFGMGLIVTSYMAGLSAVTGMSLGKAVLWRDADGVCHTSDTCAAFSGSYTLILRDDALAQGLAACPDCGAADYLVPGTVLANQ